VRYVNRLIADPSGRPIPIAGRAILAASFFPATAQAGAHSVPVPQRVAFALESVMTVTRAGDFESVLSYGIGLAKRTTFHVSTHRDRHRHAVQDRPQEGVPRELPRFARGTHPSCGRCRPARRRWT